MKTFQTSLVLTALISLATCADVCQHKADRSKDPSGNPLRQPALDTQVPRGEQYQIKWDPTTTGAVSIALLRGPSTNAEEYLCLANSISNTGSFEWTPSTTLEIDTSRYGLKIIDDATGNYQYSAQFGIKKGNNEGSASSSSSSTSNPASYTRPASSTQKSKASSSVSGAPHTKGHKSYRASGTGYIYHNATSSAYHTGGTGSKTTKTTASAKPTGSQQASTSVALVTGSASGGAAGISTAVVGVDGGSGAGAATATATAQGAASATPSTFSKNTASGLKATSILLGGVAAVAFFLL